MPVEKEVVPVEKEVVPVEKEVVPTGPFAFLAAFGLHIASVQGFQYLRIL